MGLEQAWAAGFFDGEGTTYCNTHRGRYAYLRTSVGQAEEEVLRRLQKALGVGVVNGPYLRTKPDGSRSEKSMWFWSTNGAESEKALLQMWPHLSPTKRKQALMAESKREEVILDGVL